MIFLLIHFLLIIVSHTLTCLVLVVNCLTISCYSSIHAVPNIKYCIHYTLPFFTGVAYTDC